MAYIEMKVDEDGDTVRISWEEAPDEKKYSSPCQCGGCLFFGSADGRLVSVRDAGRVRLGDLVRVLPQRRFRD